uniref:Dirigent protein n=1 Tax=Fagus sylvatica TaxID=28930 RepID=A0A2N9HKD8_FAGSY
METLSSTTKAIASLLFLTLTILSTTSARTLDEQPPVTNVAPVATTPNSAATTTTSANADPSHALTFFMHDILGGSKPSAQAMTGIVNSPAINGQLPFAKPNGAVLPVNNGGSQNNDNNNLPFLAGLGGNAAPLLQNNGASFGNINGAQIPSGSTVQKLMFGTMTVFDDELTEGTRAESGNYADSLSFFGVHRTGVSESQLAIMGGTGKFVNAKGFATVKTFSDTNQQHETDGVETLLEFTVYVTY